MNTTTQSLLMSGFRQEADGYWSYKFGDNDEYELTVEPLLFGRMYIALYKNDELLIHKIPADPVDKKDKSNE